MACEGLGVRVLGDLVTLSPSPPLSLATPTPHPFLGKSTPTPALGPLLHLCPYVTDPELNLHFRTVIRVHFLKQIDFDFSI